MLKATYCRYELMFHTPAVTSRAVINSKTTYFIKIWDSDTPEVFGIGECALFKGLGCDDVPDYEQHLALICANIATLQTKDLIDYPSIRFGVETALNDLNNGGIRNPFPSGWTNDSTSIPINGLVWMGTIEQMSARVDEKIAAGFRCLKFKIGGADFDEEVAILERVRRCYDSSQLEIRLDANGAFTPDEAMRKLHRLSLLDVHSIEQPVKPHQYDLMRELCVHSPIPIALDEELIGINTREEKIYMLENIKPQFIILKPSLCGGFAGAEEWISLANHYNIGWWATSALESNIGLNAIAQWTSKVGVSMPQGLGTGLLYSNNIPSPLVQIADGLKFDTNKNWDLSSIKWI